MAKIYHPTYFNPSPHKEKVSVKEICEALGLPMDNTGTVVHSDLYQKNLGPTIGLGLNYLR